MKMQVMQVMSADPARPQAGTMKMKIMQVMSADESAGWQPAGAYNPARPQAGPMKMQGPR